MKVTEVEGEQIQLVPQLLQILRDALHWSCRVIAPMTGISRIYTLHAMWPRGSLQGPHYFDATGLNLALPVVY